MTGASLFLRMFLRRDRWTVLAWAAGAVLLYWSQAYSVDGLYTTQVEFDRAASSMGGNAAFVAMAGPPRALNTLGGQVTWQATAFGAVVAGLMSMFLVGRHTRAEEESGRDELLRGTAVGRYASLTAALGTALLANLLLGVLVALSLWAYPLAGADSWALGLGLTAIGWCFTGTALVAAQLAGSTRGMYGLAGSVLGLSYALRAVGDVGNHVLSWLSPIGWYQAMHAFSGLRWWPVLLPLAAAVAATATAYALFGRRDLGAGLLAVRPGPDRAPPGLRSGLGLAWRLQRGTVVGWLLGVAFTALAYGAIGNDVGTLVGDSRASRELFAQGGGDLVDAFYATAALMLALLACGFAIASALRPRSEEDDGRVEALVATALPRTHWFGGHALVTALGAVAVLAGAGLGLGGGYLLVTGDAGAVLRLGLPLVSYLPAVLLLAALTHLLYGVSPRLAALGWLPLVLAVVVMFFGDLLRLPQWLQDLSPFEHLALVPAQEMRWWPFVVLCVLATLVWTTGLVAFRRRDLR
ncbi:ABC transporter permease [Nocardioides panaciterrulae]|uniref:ABC-2 type transport system permease protein n=1 Tax=Nocardioides panaciterrulae TaxID=661492 RepID=A0A7Y9E5R8_9ACTN|nr:ABC transporter permease [Nocardioides panaciterrulae]NYD41749.1 ABC-2 type transport system permease protein [Nocardioides panaciterrulae]